MQLTRSRMPGRQSLASTGVVLALQFMCGSRSRGENHADFRYERYTEDNGRVQVETYSAIAEQAINDHIALRAQAVYDGISGATPTGGPPPVGSNKVPTVEIDDIRRAGSSPSISSSPITRSRRSSRTAKKATMSPSACR